MFEEIKKSLDEIIEITKKYPENLQEKCFEILLLSIVNKHAVITPDNFKDSPQSEPKALKYKIPINVKAFFQQQNIEESLVDKIFLIEKEEIKEIYKIDSSEKVGSAQIKIALLSSLKNALLSGTFLFKIEEVRKLCQDFNKYDSANFTKNFRNNSTLFKKIDDPDIDIELSPDGKTKLADILDEYK